ncbi:MAG: AzlD domain-containing protein [Candidatus Puniceispirillaceae bacterium]
MIWLIIISSGLITFAMRFVFFTSAMPSHLSSSQLVAMRLVPVAVLWTIVVAEVFLSNGAVADLTSNPRIIAAFGAALIAYWTKSVLLTIGCGLPLLWAARYVFG